MVLFCKIDILYSRRYDRLSGYIIIDNNHSLGEYIGSLSEARRRVIALDTEANNHKYAYGQQLCLVQIYDGENVVIIDPNNIKDQILRVLFENRDILKVMYDAPNDISLLVNSKKITIKCIMDLRSGVELLEYDKQDLHSVIYAEFKIQLKHKRHFQNHNWLRRPLSEDAIEYAINDVKYLLRLKDIILRKLYAQQLLDLFMLRNIRVQNREYYIDPRYNYRRLKGFKNLSEERKPVFKRLFDVREEYARLINMPAANVFSNKSLLAIASKPQNLEDVVFPKRLDEHIRARIMRDLKRALR